MYYPYLRGRQYELIALRELVEKDLIGDKIIPIVEPVKVSPTLLSCAEIFIKGDKKIGIIQNPLYGSFDAEIAKEENKSYREKYVSFFQGNCFLPVYIFNKQIKNMKFLNIEKKSIAICTDKDMASSVDALSKIYNCDSFIVSDDRIFKRSIHGNRILRSDNFKKKQKNADYVESVDEFFSDDHLYFNDEGYKGFSDFSIIGDDYNESGFAPYAVVIHMVYFDANKNLRIHHFVSESNDDYDDPAGKFSEALKKLVESPLFKNCDTFAYNEFRDFYNRGIYSGLGVVKKLSLMHHFELMSKFLDKKD
jgi:hypothetical protein